MAGFKMKKGGFVEKKGSSAKMKTFTTSQT